MRTSFDRSAEEARLRRENASFGHHSKSTASAANNIPSERPLRKAFSIRDWVKSLHQEA